jgi:hypothetical protein
MGVTAPATKNVPRTPIWPVLTAPLIALVYYAALKIPFAQSIASALGSSVTVDVSPGDLTKAQWGSHWVYRIVAETCSIALATFVAAGLARGREQKAGIASGVAISLLLFVTVATALGLIDSAGDLVPEPWYQHLITGVVVLFAPIIGMLASEQSRTLNARNAFGFCAINRFHFLWLWLAVYFYASDLVGPIARIVTRPETIISSLLILALVGILAAVLIIPGFYGLALLSGHKGDKLHPAIRNLLGVIVLVAGFLIGDAIQTGLLEWIGGLFTYLQSHFG